MDEDTLRMHLGASGAGWWIAHRLLGVMVDKGIMSHAEVVAILQEGAQANVGGGPVNQASRVLLEQLIVSHSKAAGVRPI